MNCKVWWRKIKLKERYEGRDQAKMKNGKAKNEIKTLLSITFILDLVYNNIFKVITAIYNSLNC